MQAKSELEAENAFGERLSLAVLLAFVDSANNLPVYVSYFLALINLYFFNQRRGVAGKVMRSVVSVCPSVTALSVEPAATTTTTPAVCVCNG